MFHLQYFNARHRRLSKATTATDSLIDRMVSMHFADAAYE